MPKSDTKVLRIEKVEAARRQLETSALLIFNQTDPVSAHTLASAARQILSDIAAKSGDEGFIEGSLSLLNDEALAREIRKHIREPQNFFKHADRTAKAAIEFSPNQTGLYILDAYDLLIRLTGEKPLLLRAFEAWFLMRHLELSARNPRIHTIMSQAAKEFGHLSPLEFLRDFQSNASRIHAPQHVD